MGALALHRCAIVERAVQEAAMSQEELVVLEPHGAVEPVGFSRRIMTESCLGDLVPLAIGGSIPRVSVQGFAGQVAIFAEKVFAEAVQAPHVSALLGGTP